MDKQLQQIFSLFGMLFNLHIRTKTTDRLFHTESAAFYEFAFGAFHTIYERAIDLWLMPSIECEVAKKDTMTNLLELQNAIEWLIPTADTKWFENLLIGLADTLEWHIGNMKSLMPKEEEEEEEEEAPELPEAPSVIPMPKKK